MRRPSESPIRLGSGHCCACASTCNHIGPIRLCQMHQEMETCARGLPRSPEDFLTHEDRDEWSEWSERNRLRRERIRRETGIGQVG